MKERSAKRTVHIMIPVCILVLAAGLVGVYLVAETTSDNVKYNNALNEYSAKLKEIALCNQGVTKYCQYWMSEPFPDRPDRSQYQ